LGLGAWGIKVNFSNLCPKKNKKYVLLRCREKVKWCSHYVKQGGVPQKTEGRFSKIHTPCLSQCYPHSQEVTATPNPKQGMNKEKVVYRWPTGSICKDSTNYRSKIFEKTIVFVLNMYRLFSCQ
jgi:hypothetical protein